MRMMNRREFVSASVAAATVAATGVSVASVTNPVYVPPKTDEECLNRCGYPLLREPGQSVEAICNGQRWRFDFKRRTSRGLEIDVSLDGKVLNCNLWSSWLLNEPDGEIYRWMERERERISFAFWEKVPVGDWRISHGRRFIMT